EEKIEILQAKTKIMNDHLKALENKPVIDSKTKLNYISQILYRQKQLEKLKKDYEGLKIKLEILIEKNDSLQTELFDLKKQTLNKFNKMTWAQKKTIQIDKDLNTSKDNNKTRKGKVDECTKNFKRKILESYTMNQVNYDEIEPID
ncbi:21129_t:CDS:1, partial [Gigaspora margarita]